MGSTVFQLVRIGLVSLLQAHLVIQTRLYAGMSCDHMIRPTKQDTHLGVILQKKYCLLKVQRQRNLPWCKTLVMKKLHYMAVLFQMFHVGIIRNRISKKLMSVSLQVTVNCLCHGSSVKTQHIKEEQLDTKQLHETSVSVLSRSSYSMKTYRGQT